MAPKRTPPNSAPTSKSKQPKLANPPTSTPAKAKNTIIRFNSASPAPFHNPPAPHTASSPPSTFSSDSDAAPESLPASTATAQVKAAAASQARARDRERRDEKSKRRELDRKLKAQTQGRARKREKRRAKQEDESESERERRELPEFLPEEVLADERLANRPATPEAEEEKLGKKGQARKVGRRTVLDVEEKKPKDVKRGGVTVSVLQEQSKVLPPKVSKGIGNLRAKWLEQNRRAHRKARFGGRAR